MNKNYSLVIVAFLCFVLSGFGQIVIISENIGTGSGNQIISATIFENSGTLIYSGTGDTRTTNPSNGMYVGASGGKNVMLNNTGETFIIDDINLMTYSSTTLSLGIRKATNLENGSGLIIEYSTSGSSGVYTDLNWGKLSTGNGTATWYLVTGISLPTNITTLRFKTTNDVEFRLDDMLIKGIVTSTNFVDYCNLQFPENGNISVGNEFNVYAQVYETGVTEPVGQGANINGWIGYSTSNTNPNTWTNWISAGYLSDQGNNDNYAANIGSALPSGTYYYASRFQISDGPYRYGGYNAGGGGYWNGTTNVSGVLSVDTVDFANLQFPGVGTINLGNAYAVYGQVYEQEVTPGFGQGLGIVAEMGYSSTNSNPKTWTNWISANYNAACSSCNSGQNDEYAANLGGAITAASTYYYATRFRLNNGIWLYGGILNDGTAGGFWDGSTYISGVLNVIAPEIDIERNTNASIPTSSIPSTGFNTVFATTIIGNSTSPKTYFIHNEGAANLVVTSLTSTNSTEFSIALVPNATFPSPTLPLTIGAGQLVEFEIVFTPNSILPSTTRSSTIIIRSNDADEDPYTLGVRGTANCSASSLNLTPINGPVGTVVTIQGTNFGAATFANFNGTPVSSLIVLSSTTIEVIVPSGATTGSLEVTNQIGCKSSFFFTIINNQITSCEGSGTLPNDLFISEITDKGSGSHSYIEIYNGTGATINMTAGNYQIRIHNNGNVSPTASINLTGNIPNNTVKVLAIGGNNATDPEGGYTAQFFSSTGGINDDDNVRLYKGSGSGTLIDLWGETNGNAFTIASKDYGYRRINSGITVPSTTWNPNDWEAFTPVEYSNIGLYDFSVGVAPSVALQPVAPISNCDLNATLTIAGAEGYNATGDTQELTYQWFYNAPSTNTWVEILSTNFTYDGQQSPVLEILITLTLDKFQFYCQVREDSATCYKATNAVRLKVEKTTWNGSIWSPAAPSINTIAVIDKNYSTVTSGSFSACQLLINPGATLNVGNSTYVEVQNYATINGHILVETHGSFVQRTDLPNGFILNSGASAKVNKSTSVLQKWYDYTYWSSPVFGATVGTAIDIAPANRRYWYDATKYLDVVAETNNNNAAVSGHDDIDDNGDDWTIAAAGMVMAPGQGFAATATNLGMFPSTRQIVFEGTYNTGTLSTPVYWNGDNGDNDWNLIGNPYPGTLSFNDFYDANSTHMDGAVYLWSHGSPPSNTNNGNQAQNFNLDDYAVISRFGGNTAGGSKEIPDIGNFIPSGQSFFLKGLSNGNVTFNNTMRRADLISNNQFFRTTNTIEVNRLWINLTSDEGVFNQILMTYVEGGTKGDDGMAYDASRNQSSGVPAILYTKIEGVDKVFAIQSKDPSSLTLEEVIPLGFYSSIISPTIYTLSVAQLKGDFFGNNTIYLKDNSLNIVHNLTKSNYTFTSGKGEFNNRFEVVFKDNQTLSVIENEIPASGLTIVELNDGNVKFTVSNSLNIKSVEIIDQLGRTLYSLKGDSPSETYSLTNLSQAAYIAKVLLSNGQVITKRTVKRN